MKTLLAIAVSGILTQHLVSAQEDGDMPSLDDLIADSVEEMRGDSDEEDDIPPGEIGADTEQKVANDINDALAAATYAENIIEKKAAAFEKKAEEK